MDDAPQGGETTGPGNKLRILHIEDDPGDVLLARALLRQAGVEAEWSHAVRLAEVDFGAAGAWADCVLVDLGLPDSQGLDAVEQVLRYTPWLPVVVVSGNTDRALALRAVREGAQDYLVKGQTDADLLVKTIRYAIGRKKIERELRQAQQLARLGRLAGGIAHHFNNLLAIITNSAEFVASALAEVPADQAGHWRESRGDVGQILDAARRAADLTRQLTVVAEQDRVRPEVVQLNDVIKGARSALSDRLGAGIELEAVLDPGLRPVVADTGHIGQILDCLADNARDAMPGGGRLTISTSDVAGTWARLRVCDTGSGIGAELMDQIFDPFFTTKPPGQGVGLGLAAVHAIVTRWGGRLEVQSAPGAGTTFTVLFPAAP